MTTETKPKETTIDQAQAELARLAEEEAGIEGHLEAKEQELAEAEESGNWQRAAALATEINYLKGQGNHSQRDRIARDRQATRRELWDGLAAEMDRQEADFMSRSLAQKAKEDKARAALREASGCDWQPKVDLVTIQGLLRHIPQKPLSQTLEEQAKYRRDLAVALRSPNPDRFKNTTREALNLIPSPETE